MAELDLPAKLTVSPDGNLAGATGRYVKKLQDLDGVYRNQTAFAELVESLGGEHEVYWVNSQDHGAHEVQRERTPKAQCQCHGQIYRRPGVDEEDCSESP